MGWSWAVLLKMPGKPFNGCIWLIAVKEQDGAAMPLGNVSSFLEIFIERDLSEGRIYELEAQELIDQLVMKLRMVRHLRPAAYDERFGGDPGWITEAIGGLFEDGTTKVTKTSFRFLQTLYNLGPSQEPKLTVLWTEHLPEDFKNFCAQVTVDTSAIQYENDELIRKLRGSDDYGIACCASYQEIGKRIQFFGAIANLPKALLLALNAGREEVSELQILKDIAPLEGRYLDCHEVMGNFRQAMVQLARVYAKTMNIVHYMHDRYYYEKAQFAFLDTDPAIEMVYGAAGISNIADSLSAIKYAKVRPARNAKGLTVDFEIEGDFPKYGKDDRGDDIARKVAHCFLSGTGQA